MSMLPPCLLFETILAWRFGNVNQKMRNKTKTLAKKNLMAGKPGWKCKFQRWTCEFVGNWEVLMLS
ncbi:MAG: hypothetical protein QM739_19190 [Propionivibrio sp.]